MNVEDVYRRSPVVLQNGLATAYGLGQLPRRHGGAYRRHVVELQARQWWSTDRLMDDQASRLRRMVTWCAARVPHYRDMFRELGLTADDIRWPADLSSLPILDKETVRAEPERFLPDRIRPRLVAQTTGGTTGTPLRYWATHDAVRFNYAVYEARSRGWAGVRFGDRMASLHGQPIVPASDQRGPYWRRNWAFNQLYLSVYHLSDRTLPDYVRALASFRPRLIAGYTSAVHRIAVHLCERGDIGRINPRSVLVSSETLYPSVRRDIERAFGCRVFNAYSLGELVAYVSECEQGDLHVSTEYGVLELVQLDGQTEMVASGLINDGMPLLRYRTGDLATASDRSSARCARGLPCLSELTGRVDDVVRTPEGATVGPAPMSLAFQRVPHLRRAQARQDSVEELVILLEVDPQFDSDDEDLLEAELRRRLGSTIKLLLERADAIPRTAGGKERLVVSSLANGSHSMNRIRRPRIGFVGIHAGRRQDQPVSQNETLAALFEAYGYETRHTSSVRRPALRTLHQIVSILGWRRVDVVVVAVFSGRSFWIAELASALARLKHKRLILFLHGGNLASFGAEHEAWVSRVFRRADLLLAPSDFLARTFRSWGFDVRVIPNVLDIERYDYRQRSPARPRLLWMRTFEHLYDPEMAVRALTRILVTHPRACLTMAGADRGCLQSTRAEAARLGAAEAVTFPGYLDEKAKRAAFTNHDLYLNTNRVDNMPVSLLEAAASGLVPVATEAGGIVDLVADGVNGRLVAPGDDEAMADAVLDLLADPERCAAMSAEARRLAERSAWPAVRERWVEELSRLLPEFDLTPAETGGGDHGVGEPGSGPNSKWGRWSVRDARPTDLGDIAALHVAAFPDSALSRLGDEAVRRNYQFQFSGPHDLTALVVTDGGRPVGFLFGGVFRGSMIGFLKKEKRFLLVQALRHPRLLVRAVFWRRVALAGRLLAVRSADTEAEDPTSVPDRSFGVLVVAVDPGLQGQGVGRLLIAEAERRARSAGFTSMHLTVHPGNGGASSFYESLGWAPVLTAGRHWTGLMSSRLGELDARPAPPEPPAQLWEADGDGRSAQVGQPSAELGTGAQ